MVEYSKAELVDRISIKLSDDSRKKLNNWLNDRIYEIEEARSPFLERQKRYLFDFDDYVTYTRKGPWDNSSNLHMPLVDIMVNTYQSRFYNIFSNENAVTYKGREGTDDELARILRSLRNWYMWDYINEYKGIKGFIREIFYDTVTVGFGIGLKDWQRKQIKTYDIEFNELSREMQDLAPQIKAAASKKQFLETEEEAQKTSVSVKPYKEVEKIITKFEGSRIRTIPFEQAYFPNTIQEGNDLDAPQLVMIEVEMSVSDIMLKIKTGEWDETEGMKIVNESGATPSLNNSNIQQYREDLSGYSEGFKNKEDMRTIQYCFATYDIDDDKIAEEIVITRSPNGAMPKITFLNRISPSNMRPLVKFDCFMKSRQAYSRGVPEKLHSLSEEMDMIHNKRQDYLSLQTCPFGVYRGSSSLKNAPIRIGPGKFIPVDEVTDMKVLNFQTNALALTGEEDRLWYYAERLLSSSSIDQGMVPNKVGPLRSTSGVAALTSQSDKEFKKIIDPNASQWRKLEILLMCDLDLRIHHETKARVLGASVKDYMQSAEKVGVNPASVLSILNQFDISINVANITKSDELFRSEATIILQMLTAPGIAQQLGIVGPKALVKAYKDWLDSYNKNPDDYVDTPPFVGSPLTLWQEIQICYQGQLPPMAMQDDHQGKAASLQQWMQEPEYLEAKNNGHANAEADRMLMAAINKHMSIFNILSQQQSLPNPQGNNNTNTSMTIAGRGENQYYGRGETNGQGENLQRGDSQNPDTTAGMETSGGAS